VIVVDASLAVSLLLNLEPVASRAWSRLEGERRLEAPEVFALEVANALRGLARAGRIEPARARGISTGITRKLPISLRGHDPLLERIWALRDNLTAYDASYVALAEALDTPLLTEDRGIAQAPGICCEVELFA